MTSYDKGSKWGSGSTWAYLPVVIGICGLVAGVTGTSLLAFSVMLIGIGAASGALLYISRDVWREPEDQIAERKRLAADAKAELKRRFGR